MDCRILKKRKCKITQYYNSNHQGIDIVGEKSTLDYITAHTDGKIVTIQDGIGNMKGSIGNISYGNYVKIEHQNGYCTLYAHMQNGIDLKINQMVKKGQILGYISNSGNANEKNLHFEVLKDDKKINPYEYLNKDLPKQEQVFLKYNIGDIVEINGVYISSTSKEKLRPLITRGTITNIIENTNNPYLLDNGNIGWVNDNTIISKDNIKYLSNKSYHGTSIVDALNEININSSYQYRKALAKLNNISNYTGTKQQNMLLLNLLKQGTLEY